MTGAGWNAVVGAWLGCAAPPVDPTAGDSGAPACATAPCAADLEPAIHEGAGVWSGWEGYAVAVGRVGGEARVFTGAPRAIGPYYGQQRVTVLDPLALTSTAVLLDNDGRWSFFGGAIAVDPGGDRFAVAASAGSQTSEQYGAVYVFDAVPAGVVDKDDATAAVLYGTDSRQSALGQAVALADVGGGVELLASAPNSEEPLGFLYAFDPSIRGEHGVEAARRSITAPYVGSFGVWDSDGDGVGEPLVRAFSGGVEVVQHYPGPWTTDLTEADADAQMTGRAPEEFDLGQTLVPVGDLDGDGRADLAVGAPNAEGPAYRSGILFVAPGGAPLPTAADDLPTRIEGEHASDYVGASVATGDLDGDGQPDLVVGGPGGWPEGTPGEVLVFLGPVERSAYTASDAHAVVHGDRPYSYFGRAVAAWDADGDGRDDVYVGSPGAGEHQEGRTYLFPAATLLP